MGEAAKLLAIDLLRATGTATPVQAHKFADAAGFTLRPIVGHSRAVGDVFEYDGTRPMDEQESAILDLLARWVCQRSGDPCTDEEVAELIDIWLEAASASSSADDADGSGSSKRG